MAFFINTEKLIREFQANGVESNTDDNDQSSDYTVPDDNGEQNNTQQTTDNGEPEDYTSDDSEGDNTGVEDNNVDEPEIREEPTQASEPVDPVQDTTSTEEDTNDEDDQTDYTLPDDNDESNTPDEPQAGGDEPDENGGNDDTTEDYTSDDGSSDNDGEVEDTSTDDDTSDDSGDIKSDDEIKTLDQELFSDLSEGEVKAKNIALKKHFLSLYEICSNTIEAMTNVDKAPNNIEVIDFIGDTLDNLRTMVSDYVDTIYEEKSYIENYIYYNKCLATLSGIDKVLKELGIQDDEK